MPQQEERTVHCAECKVLKPVTCTCHVLIAEIDRTDRVAVPLLEQALGRYWDKWPKNRRGTR